MKKKKSFKKVVSLALAAILTAAPVLSTAMVTEAADPVILAPENMVQFDIVDEDGNALDGVAYTITDSAGVDVATFSTGGSFSELNDSGIRSTNNFTVYRNDFEELIAPTRLIPLPELAIEYAKVAVTKSNSLPLSSGEELDITLFVLPDEEISLTVPANTVMVNVDEKWANGVAELELITNNTSYNMNSMAGTLTSVPMSADGVVGTGYWAPDSDSWGGTMHSTDYYTLPTGETQYVKVRMKVSAVSRQYNDEGLYSGYLGDITIASGVTDPGESVLWIVSGSVINMPVPDENGYIEFYVEASEGKYQSCVSNHWENGCGGGHNPISKIAYEEMDMTVRAVDFPTDMPYMIHVPADTYTINVTSVPEGYEIPDPITFTVQDSSEFQTAKIVLAGAHTHSYGTAYESDEDNHWNECACGAEGNVAAHSFEWITDKEATVSEAGSKHEECSVCGYEKAPVEIPKLTTEDDSKDDTNGDTDTNTNNAGSASAQNPVTEDVKDEVPDTGDTYPVGIAVFGGLALVSGMGFVVSYGRKKSAC